MRLLCWGIGIVLETMDILLVPAGYWSWRGLGAVGLWYPLSSGLGSAWPQAIYIPVTIVNLNRCKFHMPHGCQFWLVCQHKLLHEWCHWFIYTPVDAQVHVSCTMRVLPYFRPRLFNLGLQKCTPWADPFPKGVWARDYPMVCVMASEVIDPSYNRPPAGDC